MRKSRKTEWVTVRLTREERKYLSDLARKSGVSDSALIRVWINRLRGIITDNIPYPV